MTDETRFSVLVSTDEGVTWKLHRGIIANTTEQACKRVRDTHYSAGSPDCPDREGETLFYATQAFRPRRMVPKKVTRLTMQQVELGPEPNGEAPMPHQPRPGDSSVAPGEFDS